MSVAVEVTRVTSNQNEAIVDGTLTLTNNYGAAGGHGDVIDFRDGSIPSNSVPNRVEIFEAPAAGAAPSGYHYYFAPGAKNSDGKLVVMVGAAGVDTEITEGDPYPAALLALTALRFRAYFPFGV